MSRGKRMLFPKILGEEYCCTWGYLKLCKARGETQGGMAKNLEIPRHCVKDAYRFLRQGVYSCAKREDCLGEVISELEDEGSPS